MYSTHAKLATLVLSLVSTTALSAVVPGQGTWERTLHKRDINADGVADAYYDSVLGITWLSDFNYRVNHLGAGSGLTSWEGALAVASTLNVYGVGGWRLPSLAPVNGVSFQYNPTNNGTSDSGTAKTGSGWGLTSELGHLFYVTLGNKGQWMPDDSNPGTSSEVQPGWASDPNAGPFVDLLATAYWTNVPSTNTFNSAWALNFSTGIQTESGASSRIGAAFVLDGDVSAVPEPRTGTIATIGLLVTLLTSRRFRSLD